LTSTTKQRMAKTLIVENWKDRAKEIGSVLESLGKKYDKLEAYAAIQESDIVNFNLSGYNSIILTGSPFYMRQINEQPFIGWEMKFIKKALESKKPILGVCFGHQILSTVLKGKSFSSEYPERGLCKVTLTKDGLNDGLFTEMPQEFYVFQYHSDEVSITKDEVKLLAYSDKIPVQAISSRKYPAWGIQFHPEINKELGIWIIKEERRKKLEKEGYEIEKLVANLEKNYNPVIRKKIYKNFLDLSKEYQ